jgi:hypothetical protein
MTTPVFKTLPCAASRHVGSGERNCFNVARAIIQIRFGEIKKILFGISRFVRIGGNTSRAAREQPLPVFSPFAKSPRNAIDGPSREHALIGHDERRSSHG